MTIVRELTATEVDGLIDDTLAYAEVSGDTLDYKYVEKLIPIDYAALSTGNVPSICWSHLMQGDYYLYRTALFLYYIHNEPNIRMALMQWMEFNTIESIVSCIPMHGIIDSCFVSKFFRRFTLLKQDTQSTKEAYKMLHSMIRWLRREYLEGVRLLNRRTLK